MENRISTNNESSVQVRGCEGNDALILETYILAIHVEWATLFVSILWSNASDQTVMIL